MGLIDLTGQKFGKLTVIERADNRGRHVYWKCKCDCGAIHEARSDGLRNGITLSCGRCDFEDLTGKRFGRRVVLGRAVDRMSIDGYPIRYWKCECDCGTVSDVSESSLTHGKARSCGCYVSDCMRTQKTTHGGTGTRLYNIWMNMRSRTTKPSDHAWADYGGRGIKICDEWNNSFEAFRDWALTHGYSDSLSIDRIDNDGNYEPNNCRWATILQQARNKRNTIYITYDGKTLTAREWSEITGIPVRTIKGRYHDKWDVEKILTTPVKPTSRAVVSVDEEGNVKEYPSARAASRDVGVKSPNVTKACSGKNKTCAGKRWFYKEDYINEKSA